MILLAAAAYAGSCCATPGAQPAVLASCDALALNVGLGADLVYGGWSWDGAWSASGDDGGGSAVLSATFLGRFAPWLQGGVRVPIALAVERLDGKTTTAAGPWSGLAWLGLETPADWTRGPRLGLELGLGTGGLEADTPGALAAQVGVRGSREVGPWSLWAGLNGRMPILGGAPDGDAAIAVDHALGEQARIGFGAGARAAAGGLPSYGISLGPSLLLAPDTSNRITIAARAGLPIPGLGRNSPTQAFLTVDWYRVLARTD